jgi:MoaA/NifB/PqqE/SkfB family radical SAM enzyme
MRATSTVSNCCESKNSGRFDLDYDRAVRLLLDAYKRGHRELVLTGGEPMLWRSGIHTLKDIVHQARRIGFHNVTIFTNGTFPLDIVGCNYIVTIDGTPEIHNAIRQGTYDKILENVRRARGKVVATVTITKENAGKLAEIVRSIARERAFSGISFNLLTHFPPVVEKHGLTGEERRQVLDTMWQLKMQGFPVVLSKAAYTALRHNTWKRPIRQIELGTRNRVYTCCRDVDHPEICGNCGYTSCAEVAQALAGKPSAIMELLKAS